MSEKQAKGFYQQLEAHETFKLTDNLPKKEDIKEAGFIMNIGADSQKVLKRIFLNKQNGLSHITGNPVIDTYNKFNDYLIDHSKIKIKDIAVTFRLLAVMINAGLSLIRSLNTLSAQSEKNPKLSKILAELALEVETGSSLSKAMEKYPEVFSEAQIGAIQAGEASGQLNKTLLDLAAESEKTASLAGKVKGALIYPAVVVCIMTVVVFLMMVLVVPQISKLFGEAGKELPLATQILMKVSEFMVAYWWVIVAIIFGIISGIGYWKRTKSGHYYWDLFLINLPIFGDLVKKSTLTKFSYGFGNLLSSGVPIIKAMEIVATACGNEVYRRRLKLTAEDMKSGIPMAENLSNSKLFPSMLVNMIEVGEQTAQLESVTQKVGAFYDEEVSNSVSSLTKVMEPMIMVVMGVVVGGLVAAVMMPIIQLTDISGGL